MVSPMQERKRLALNILAPDDRAQGNTAAVGREIRPLRVAGLSSTISDFLTETSLFKADFRLSHF